MAIPLPEVGGAHFLNAITTGSNLINQIMANKRANQAQQIAMQQEQREQAYHPIELQKRKFELDKMQKLLPHIVQEYQDKHGAHAAALYKQKVLLPYLQQQYQDYHKAAEQLYNKNALRAEILRRAYYGQESGAQPAAPQNAIEIQPPQQPMEAAQNLGETAPNAAPIENGMENQPAQQNALAQSIMRMPKQSFINPQQQQVAMLPTPQNIASETMTPFTPEQLNQVMAQQNQMIPQTPIQKSVNESLEKNQQQELGKAQKPETKEMKEVKKEEDQFREIVMRPGNPNLQFLDKIAGVPDSGVSAPKVSQPKNGYIETTYPSGKVTMQKVPQELMKATGALTPEQNLENKLKFEEGKLNLKTAKEIRTKITNLQNPYHSLVEMKELLEEHPNLTGIGKGVSVATKLAQDKNLARFHTLAGHLQTEFASAFGPRAGIAIANLYKAIKPSIYASNGFNQGMVDQGLELLQSQMGNLAKEYSQVSSKKIDLPFNQKAGNTTEMTKNGKIYDIPNDKVEEAKLKGYTVG